MKRTDIRAFPGAILASVLGLLIIDSGESASARVDMVSVSVESTSSSAQPNVPVTFGQVFPPGALIDPDALGARTSAGTELALQVDAKARHPDGSLRHAVLTTVLPNLARGAELDVVLQSPGNGAQGQAVSLDQLLASSFDAVLEVRIGASTFRASARDLLQGGDPQAWLAGPLVSEWLVSGALAAADGTRHPHLSARFHVRAYRGIESVRVSVTLENNWTLETGPRNFQYDTSVTIQGRGTVLSQQNVTHYRQARWRRVFWWGQEPGVHVSHDAAYLQRAAVVPTYDPAVRVPGAVLSEMDSDWRGARTALMGAGFISPYMPAGGGRDDIAPLPRWTAVYLITQDERAKTVTLGTGEQAGSFGIHFRDRDTDLPVSLDTYPNMTVLGNGGIFPPCGGDCSSPYVADVAHQPSLSFVPYLVTGDYFHLEELQFWANWNLFYWGDHGGSRGLMVNDQIRAQAWGLRTLGHAAYITPDDHPLKRYFTSKLNNNLDWYDTNVSGNPPTPLGYMLNPPSLGQDRAFATWMDDFFTWSVGHLANLGFTGAKPIFDYKAVFPVGRMTHRDYCWILASTYWTRARDTATGAAFRNWNDYRVAVIRSWDDESAGPSFNGTTPGMRGDLEDDLIAAECNSSRMANILGLQRGAMIGFASSPEGYPANLQPALAISVERSVPNADLAWRTFDGRSVKPDSGDFDYDGYPQWAIVPGDVDTGGPVDPPQLPDVELSANPMTIGDGETTTLSWSATNADSCVATGGWQGSRATAGSEEVGPLNATTTFGIECSNSSGTATDSTTVNVLVPGAPTVDLSANPASVAPGSAVTLTWTSSNTTACVASGGWSGDRATSGSESVGPVDRDTDFTLSCEGDGRTVSDTVSVSVNTGGGGGVPPAGSGGGLGVFTLLGLGACAALLRRRRSVAGKATGT